METTVEGIGILDEEPRQLDGAPDWFNDSRRAGWDCFQSLAMPSRRDEEWRFARTGHLNFKGVKLPHPGSNRKPEGAKGLEKRAARFAFVNDRVMERECNLPEGVICLPLEEALKEHSEILQRYFMKAEFRLGSAKFAALHQAHVSSGMFIYVPDGVEVQDPIEISHWITGDQVVAFPHTLVVTGKNARVSVVDYFQSDASAKDVWTIPVNELVAGPGSQLTYLTLQDLGDDSRMIQLSDSSVSRDATTKSFILNAGATWVRQECLSRLLGENSHSDMLSVSIARDGQEYDQRTFQHHASARSYSDLLYKNTLYDESRTIFSGLILVDEGAHQTDAYQTCRNLLMSDSVEANSMPGLEINADQVKCSHGSTSAMIDENEIFYLRARGVKPHVARQLVAQGFSVECISRLKSPELEELVLGFAAREFHRISESVVA